MKQVTFFVGVLLAVIFTGCQSTRAGSTIFQYPVVREENYRLQAPDEIQVTVLPQSELNMKVIIRPDGKISLPLIGDVFVEGMTPMDREDISHLAQCLDDVLDLCEAVATRLNRFQFPPPPAAVELADILVRCATETEHCVQGLEHISGDHSHHWRSIHSLENQADEIERAAVFTELNRAYECIEAGTWQDYARAAVLSTHWTEICERIERATDRCEDAANVMETLSAKYG
jgi:uncharacterized protein Yka (UPF0111/DUF47 family)